jgi:hypothetical protein
LENLTQNGAKSAKNDECNELPDRLSGNYAVNLRMQTSDIIFQFADTEIGMQYRDVLESLLDGNTIYNA